MLPLTFSFFSYENIKNMHRAPHLHKKGGIHTCTHKIQHEFTEGIPQKLFWGSPDTVGERSSKLFDIYLVLEMVGSTGGDNKAEDESLA